MKQNVDDTLRFENEHVKSVWMNDHPPGTFMIRCASDRNRRDGGLVMIVGYSCDERDDYRITLISCDHRVVKNIETMAVLEAKYFLNELFRVETYKKLHKVTT